MQESRDHQPYRGAETATLMTELLFPPLAALRAMERWSGGAGRGGELPQEVARLSERLESVEEQESAIQASVEPIETEVARLTQRLKSVEKQESAIQGTVEPIETELDGIRKKNDVLERSVLDMDSALSSLRNELTAIKKANSALEHKLAELPPVPGDLDSRLGSVDKELKAVTQSNAELERRLSQAPPAQAKSQVSDVSKAILGAGGPKSDEGQAKGSPKKETAAPAKKPAAARRDS